MWCGGGVCVFASVCSHVPVCVCVCVYVYIHMYIYVLVSVYVLVFCKNAQVKACFLADDYAFTLPRTFDTETFPWYLPMDSVCTSARHVWPRQHWDHQLPGVSGAMEVRHWLAELLPRLRSWQLWRHWQKWAEKCSHQFRYLHECLFVFFFLFFHMLRSVCSW